MKANIPRKAACSVNDPSIIETTAKFTVQAEMTSEDIIWQIKKRYPDMALHITTLNQLQGKNGKPQGRRYFLGGYFWWDELEKPSFVS